MKRLMIVGLAFGFAFFAWSDSASAWQEKGDTQSERQDRRRQRPNQQTQRQRGQQDDAPKSGDIAPVFTLKSLDGESETDIGSFNGKKPVVLLFGSYT